MSRCTKASRTPSIRVSVMLAAPLTRPDQRARGRIRSPDGAAVGATTTWEWGVLIGCRHGHDHGGCQNAGTRRAVPVWRPGAYRCLDLAVAVVSGRDRLGALCALALGGRLVG